jgi:hypothetical protein
MPRVRSNKTKVNSSDSQKKVKKHEHHHRKYNISIEETSDDNDSNCEDTESSHSDNKCHKNKPRSRDSSNESRCKSKNRDSSVDSHCKSKNRHRSNSRDRDHKNKHRSHSCDEEIECKYDMCEVYQYFKNKLVCDENLMVSGSDSYLFITNNLHQSIPQGDPLTFNNLVLSKNVDYPVLNNPFFVRTSGHYLLFVSITTDSSAEFAICVNDIVQPYTSVGSNSGAGLIVVRCLLQLNKDDNLTVRNYISSSIIVNANLFAGGTQSGNNLQITLFKISNLNEYCFKNNKEVPHKIHKIFKKITHKLKADNELMVKGFNVAGDFYSKSTQVVPLNTNVKFDIFDVVTGLSWNVANPDQVQILHDGIYSLYAVMNTNTAAQFTFSINNIVDTNSIQGVSKGAGQLTLKGLFSLKKNDVITITNYSSAVGDVTISSFNGGTLANNCLLLNIFKISNLHNPTILPVNCKIEKYFECYYEEYVRYLMCHKSFQIRGSQSNASLVGTTLQTLAINQEFLWPTTTHLSEVVHKPGTTTVKIIKSGVYDIFVDIMCNEPSQYALFINGVPNTSTIFGRDSGASRCLLRKKVILNEHDVITVVNYLSSAVSLTTSINPGGSFIGVNVQFLLFMLYPLEECEKICDNKKEPKKKL